MSRDDIECTVHIPILFITVIYPIDKCIPIYLHLSEIWDHSWFCRNVNMLFWYVLGKQMNGSVCRYRREVVLFRAWHWSVLEFHNEVDTSDIWYTSLLQTGVAYRVCDLGTDIFWPRNANWLFHFMILCSDSSKKENNWLWIEGSSVTTTTSVGVVDAFSTFAARGPGFESGYRHNDFRDRNLLLSNRGMTEIMLKRRNIPQTTQEKKTDYERVGWEIKGL